MNITLTWHPDALTDSHCHVSGDSWTETYQAAIKANVKNLILVTTHHADFLQARSVLAKSQHPFLTLGTHPHEAKTYDVSQWERLFETENYIAVGECGLDYYYHHSEPQIQQSVFEHHCGMALQHHKPMIVHVRKAFEDALPRIMAYSQKGVRGVVHCFTGNVTQAKTLLDAGWYLGFTGIITFGKNVDPILEALRYAPADRILIETDSPYLAPVPHRGKPNQPGYLPLIAQKVAAVKGWSLETCVANTTRNARDLFLSATGRKATQNL